MPSSRSRARRAALPACLLAAGLVASIVAPAAVRRDSRITRTERFVEQLDPPPDLVWVHPGWRTDLAGRFGGVPTLAADRLREDALGAFPTVLVLGADSRRAAARAVGRLDESTVVPLSIGGGLPAWRVDPRTAYRVRAQLGDLLPTARVSLQGPQGDQPCTWEAARRRFRCPGPAFSWVGETAQTFAGTSTACVWAHPPPGGAGHALLISLGDSPSIQLGSRLAVGAGVTDHGARCRRCAPVDVAVVVTSSGKTTTHRLSVQRKGFVWRRWETRPGPGSIRLSVSTRDAAARHFCLDLELQDAP